jgi:hypothetical protein
MSISKGTGNSPLIQADLVYARVGGTSLRLDLYTPAGPRLSCRRCSTSTGAVGLLATSPTPRSSASCRSSRAGSRSRA